MFCEKCGTKMPEGSKFCPECGAQPASSRKKAAYGLGIAVMVLLLAGGSFTACRFGLPGKDDITMEAAAKQESDDAEIADPIRANIPMGTGNVKYQLDEMQMEKFLRIIQGEWYDSKGRKLVTVEEKRINGCEIVGIYDLAGGGGLAGGTFRLQENGQEWDVRLDWNISKSALDSLSVNRNQTLHRTPNAEAELETVGGVCLGMTPEQVEQKLGKPFSNLDKSNTVTAGEYTFSQGWYYKDKGVIISFGHGSVEGIALLKGSKLRFEKSGLNCESSLEEYAKAYGLQRIPQLPKNRYMSSQASIGNGQTLYFGMDMGYVLLSVYAT